MKTGDKTQPQRLLEEVDSTIQHTESEQYPTDPPQLVDAPKFPTIQEQDDYWRKKEEAAEPKPPRKWSAARRRRYNAKKSLELEIANGPRKPGNWVPVPPPAQEEPMAMIKFCPNCGKSIERFLA